MATALKTVQGFFPKVKRVLDADEDVNIEVTKHDSQSKAVKNHEQCAMAVACKRAMHLDGVVISRKIAYLVKGKEAVRFIVPQSVSREVVAFDRGATFEPGTYRLVKPGHGSELGYAGGHVRDNEGKANGKKKKGPRHVTANIRTALGGVKNRA